MIRRLTFVNRSESLKEARVVLFQKNKCANLGMDDVAWRSIRHCPSGWLHPFTYSGELELRTGDEFGNFSAPVQANEGFSFEIRSAHDGRPSLRLTSSRTESGVAVSNRMARGAVDVNVLRDQRVMARWPELPPSQEARFCFDTELWIGLTTAPINHNFVQPVRQVESATRLPLARIRSADIVMTGGGVSGKAISFHLENINSG